METIGGVSTWRLYLMSGVLIQYCIPLLIITFCHCHMAQVLWGTKTPGQAYDQRDEVILANKRKVRMYVLSKGGLISEIFSLWLKSQIKVPNHSPEHLLFRRIVLKDLAPFFLDLSQNRRNSVIELPLAFWSGSM